MRQLALLLLVATGVLADEKTITFYVSDDHPYSLRYDPSIWKSDGSDEKDIDLVLEHRSGNAHAAVYAFAGEATLDDLRANALKNGRAMAPDLKVVGEERSKRDGADVLTMHMTGNSAEGPVTYRGVYWAGAGQAVQLVASSTKETDADVKELLDGLSISVSKRVPEEKRAFTMSFPPLKWRITDDGTRDGVMMFMHVEEDAIAFAGATRENVTRENLRAYLLDKSKAIGPGARFVSQQEKTVNGAPVSVLQLDGLEVGGTKSVLYGYFFTVPGVYIEAVTLTPVHRFATRKNDLTEFLDGLQIHVARE